MFAANKFVFVFIFIVNLLTVNPLVAAEDGDNGLIDMLGSVAERELENAIDRKATLVSMEVIEQRGSSIVVDVSYKRIYKYADVELSAVVLNGGKQLPGFSSTIASLDSEAGTGRLTIKWDSARNGNVVKSDQVKVYVKREGKNVKSKAFAYSKEWSALDEIVNESDQGIQVAMDDASQGQVEEVATEDTSEDADITASTALSDCANSIQGKIAWDYKGSKQWGKNNLARLCQGAETSIQPGVCFNRVMHGGVNYGGGTKWQWQNALNLCQGTQNASATISCFKNEISKKHAWADAIKTCKKATASPAVTTVAVRAPAAVNATATTCYNSIQGKIAWDYKGSRQWSKSNIDSLCKGAETSNQPGVCFNQVMHGGVNWGGGTKWEWANTLNLCQGTKNAAATVSCFKSEIRSGKKWSDAIRKCKQ